MTGAAWLAFAIHGAWQSAIVAVIVLLVAAVARRLPLALREGLLILALVKFLVPPFLSLPTGLLALMSDLVPRAASRINAAAPPAALSESWLSVFAIVQLTGTCIVACGALCGWLRVRRWVQNSAPVEATLAGRSAALAQQLGLKRAPDILMSPAISAPAAAGVLRRVVLLPASIAARLTPRELDALLAHELTHHARHHLAIGWIRVFVCALWWWHPVAWIVSRRLRSLQEQVCDEAVVAAGVMEREPYCDMLIRAAGAAQPAFAVTAPFAERLHPLARRLRRLLDDSADLRLPRPAVHALLVLAALIMLPGMPTVSAPVDRSAVGERRNEIASFPDAEAIPIVGDVIALAESADRVIDRVVSSIEQLVDPPPRRD